MELFRTRRGLERFSQKSSLFRLKGFVSRGFRLKFGEKPLPTSVFSQSVHFYWRTWMVTADPVRITYCSFSLLRPKKTNQKKGRPVPWSFGLPCASHPEPGAQKLALLRQFARLIGPVLRCSAAGQWVEKQEVSTGPLTICFKGLSISNLKKPAETVTMSSVRKQGCET